MATEHVSSKKNPEADSKAPIGTPRLYVLFTVRLYFVNKFMWDFHLIKNAIHTYSTLLCNKMHALRQKKHYFADGANAKTLRCHCRRQMNYKTSIFDCFSQSNKKNKNQTDCEYLSSAEYNLVADVYVCVCVYVKTRPRDHQPNSSSIILRAHTPLLWFAIAAVHILIFFHELVIVVCIDSLSFSNHKRACAHLNSTWSDSMIFFSVDHICFISTSILTTTTNAISDKRWKNLNCNCVNV